MSKMKAALMMGPKNIVTGELDIPAYGDDDVLVNIKNVGICGADLDFFTYGAIGAWVLSYPHVLGHEPAGVVAEVGKNVTHVKKGDKVAVEPGKPCFSCTTCLKGKYNMCPNMRFMSVPGDAGAPGAFCEYIAWPGRLVYKVPDNVDTADACLAEPLAVAMHSVNQSGIKFGQSAAILGSGCIGMCMVLALQARGIKEIYMTDIAPARLEKAKALGVTEVFNDAEVDIVKSITDRCGGVDVVYECAASQKVLDQAIPLLNTGGNLCLVGLWATAKQEIDLNGLIFKEASISTNFRYRHVYPDAIAAIASGAAPVSKIVSHRFPVEKLGEAIELNIADKNLVSKIVIDV